MKGLSIAMTSTNEDCHLGDFSGPRDAHGSQYSRACTSISSRIRLTILAVLIAMVGLLTVTIDSAEALPAGYAPNGCTLSPDRGWWPVYYDFKAQCNRHDYCYDEMWYGNSADGRRRCDETFLNEMRGWCNWYYGAWWLTVERGKCHGVAWTYYTAVRNLGGPYFNNPYKN